MKKNNTKIEIIVQGRDEYAEQYRNTIQGYVNEICEKDNVNAGVNVSVSASSEGRMTAILSWNEEIEYVPGELSERFIDVTPDTLIKDTRLAQRIKNNISVLMNMRYAEITVRDVANAGKKNYSGKRGFGHYSMFELGKLVESAGLEF